MASKRLSNSKFYDYVKQAYPFVIDKPGGFPQVRQVAWHLSKYYPFQQIPS